MKAFYLILLVVIVVIILGSYLGGIVLLYGWISSSIAYIPAALIGIIAAVNIILNKTRKTK